MDELKQLGESWGMLLGKFGEKRELKRVFSCILIENTQHYGETGNCAPW